MKKFLYEARLKRLNSLLKKMGLARDIIKIRELGRAFGLIVSVLILTWIWVSRQGNRLEGHFDSSTIF